MLTEWAENDEQDTCQKLALVSLLIIRTHAQKKIWKQTDLFDWDPKKKIAPNKPPPPQKKHVSATKLNQQCSKCQTMQTTLL